MSSIVTSILSSTVGLLWNKALDATAKNLKDGNVTDAKIREVVVRELNDIKTKLDGLSRKDFLSSYTSLEEGVELLSDSLDKLNDEQNAVVNEDKDDGSVTSSTMPSGGDILNDALQLSQVMEKLRLVSNHSESAKKRFEDARKQATLAFWNEALNMQDRIFAAKLRVVSEILECLDSPDTAVTSCLLFLEQLHDLSAVREMFSVYLGGGVKSILGKTERVENIKSIMMINYVLYQFVPKFSSKYYAAFNWPVIQLNDGTQFNPISSWQEVSMRKSWGDELKQPPSKVKVDKEITVEKTAVNSRGEIVAAQENGVRIISRTGKSKSFLPLPVLRSEDEDGNEIKHDIVGVAVDEENNVYLIVFYYKENPHEKSEPYRAVLYVFDEHCNHVKQKRELKFLPKVKYGCVPLAVNKNKDILMIGDDNVNVYDVTTDELKCQLNLMCSPEFIGFAENNEIIIGSQKDNTVEIYTEEGNLETTIKLPADHEVRGMAFHFGINKIIVLSLRTTGTGNDSYHLHFYTKTGEQHTSTDLHDKNYTHNIPKYKSLRRKIFQYANIKSHPNCAAAVLTRKTILYQ